MLAFLWIFFMCVVCPLGIWVQHASATRDFWLAHLMWCPAVVNWLCLIETKWNKLWNIQAILSLIRNSPMSNWTTSPLRSSIISLQSTQPFVLIEKRQRLFQTAFQIAGDPPFRGVWIACPERKCALWAQHAPSYGRFLSTRPNWVVQVINSCYHLWKNARNQLYARTSHSLQG